MSTSKRSQVQQAPRPRRRSPEQKQQLQALHSRRGYQARGVAYRYGPVIKWCLLNEFSHRDIRDYFNFRSFPTPSQLGKPGRPKIGPKWSLIQIQRLIKTLGEGSIGDRSGLPHHQRPRPCRGPHRRLVEHRQPGPVRAPLPRTYRRPNAPARDAQAEEG